MSDAKMTLLGFSRWMKDSSDDLFKAFDDLPAGIDRDVLVNNILLRGGEFEVIYSDPYFMQESIYTWLAKWRRTLEKWLVALAVEYDPLNNYDRHEEYTDTEGIGDTETRSGTRIDGRSRVNSENMTGNTGGSTSGSTSGSTGGASSAATNTTGTDTGSQGTENQISAFDASTYQPKNRSDTTTGSSTSSSTGTTSANSATSLETRSETTNESMSKSASESGSESGSESTADTRAASRNRLLQHSAHLFGNIGVTTSQEMLQAELSIAEWNLYDHITDLFLTEYIIPVYV